MTTMMTSREFNQDTSGAKKAAVNGPVIITDRGEPSHVLLSIKEYQRLTGTPSSGASNKTIVELLAMPGVEEIEFDPPKLGDISIPADFS